MRIKILVAAFAVFIAWGGRAQEEARAFRHLDAAYLSHALSDSNRLERAVTTNLVSGIAAKALKKFEGNPDILLRPGMLADRNEKVVYAWGDSVGLAANEPLEFFAVSSGSGFEYESIAVIFCQPSAIREGLEFIGMKAGEPVNPSIIRFWPKGERVIMDVHYHSAHAVTNAVGKGKQTSFRMEDAVFDRTTEGPLARTGMVFVGSSFTASITNPDEQILAADHFGPMAIASNFNLLETILDLPAQGEKGSVYGQQVQAPDYQLQKGTPLMVTLRPDRTDGSTRVKEITLSVSPSVDPTEPFSFRLLDQEGKDVLNDRSAKAVFPKFDEWVKGGFDPFVTLDYSKDLTVQQLVDVSEVLEQMDHEAGMRIEPPVKGQLYYKSYIAPENFRDRSARPSQPWEVILRKEAKGKSLAELVYVQEEWNESKLVMTEKRFPIDSAAALKAKMNELDPERKTLFLFAAASLSHAALLEWIEPLLAEKPVVFVFSELDAPSKEKD